MVRYRLLTLAIAIASLTGCSAPEGPECSGPEDCASNEICLASGGVFFGGSYCAVVSDAAPQDEPDAGSDGGNLSNCSLESACDGVDDDGDGIIDEGCSCSFAGSNDGVCGTAVTDCSGRCIEPEGYEFDETLCDELDNDCDGAVDEGQSFDAVTVAAGRAHTCAGESNGDVYCWGSDALGQLGTGDSDDSGQIRKIAINIALDIVSSWSDHTCAVSQETGAAYCWGENDSNQSSLTPDTPVVKRPNRIEPPDGTTAWTDISAGDGFTCGIADERIFCWGSNNLGQLGQATTDPLPGPAVVEVMQFYRSCTLNTECGMDGVCDAGYCLPAAAQGYRFQAIWAGASHACALDQGDRLWCWGANSSAQVGRSSTDGVGRPQVLESESAQLAWKSAAPGSDHTCVSSANDEVFCFGSNVVQQLGTTVDQTAIVSAETTASQNLVSGDRFTCATDATAGVVCWGSNDDGRLGRVGDGAFLPEPVDGLDPAATGAVRAMDAGIGHACAATEQGLVCWGDNTSGQLGASSATEPGSIARVSCANKN